MLTRRQLEDLSKCGYIHCANCSCAPICEGVEMKTAQTALVLVDMVKRTGILLNDHFYGEEHYSSDGEMAEVEKTLKELAALLKGLEG